MSLALEIIKNISGFSRAKYSTWFYYRPDRVLFDAGEGISVSMRNMLYGIESIFLTHNHGDHIGGIPGILRSRASSMGDVNKPLNIFYPAYDKSIEKLKNYLNESLGNLPFQVQWMPLQPGSQIPLSANRFLEAFPTKHIANTLTLGYKIVEKRNRLKAEFRELPQPELIKTIQTEGRERVSETYQKNLLVYTGDSMPVATSYLKEAEVVIYDATFLHKEDREEETHATLEEACQSAVDAQVACLALFHFSGRYTKNQIQAKIAEIVEEKNIEFPVFYMFPNSYPMNFKKIH